MNVKRLDHLNFTVRNLKESVNWYKDVFGFEVVETGEQEAGPWAIVRSHNALLCMYEHKDFAKVDKVKRVAKKQHGYGHFAFAIENEEDFEAKIKEYNIPVSFGGPLDYAHSRSWYIQDPTGYEIEVAKWNDNKVQF